MMKLSTFLFPFLALVSSGIAQDSNLEIHSGNPITFPEYPGVVLHLTKPDRKLENALIERTYRASSVWASEALVESFDNNSALRKLDPEELLKKEGVEIGPGASAQYIRNGTELRVIQTIEGHQAIEDALATMIYLNGDRAIRIRTEIFEMPTLTALELVESATRGSNHFPERNAVRALVGKDSGVDLVSISLVDVRSGQRGKSEDIQLYEILRKAEPNPKDAKEGKNNEKSEKIPVGTILEVDAVIGADQNTLDLNFSLEHHTADPELIGSDKPEASDDFLLHRKVIVTQVTMKSGSATLIGNWRPTGKPEYEKGDRMQVAFFIANVVIID